MLCLRQIRERLCRFGNDDQSEAAEDATQYLKHELMLRSVTRPGREITVAVSHANV